MKTTNSARKFLQAQGYVEDKGLTVINACRKCGIGKTLYYKYRELYKNYEGRDFERLQPARRSHAMKKSREVENAVFALAVKHPSWGCRLLALQLKGDWVSTGKTISGPTVQRILMNEGFWSVEERLHYFVSSHIYEEGTPEQYSYIAKHNPSSQNDMQADRSSVEAPGDLLLETVFCLGQNKDLGRLYLQAVIDAYSNYAWVCLQRCRRPMSLSSSITDGIKSDLAPWVTTAGKKRIGIRLEIVTHKDCECGYIKQFTRTAQKRLFHAELSSVDDFAECEKRTKQWVEAYNETEQQGYPTRGASPSQMIKQHMLSEKEFGLHDS